MSRTSRKGIFQRFFGSRLFLVGAIVVLMLVVLSFVRAYYQDYKIRQQITELQEEVKQLEKKKLESMKILEYVSSDAFVEEKARTELNLKKPGERVIYVDGVEEMLKQESYKVPYSNDSSPSTLSNPMKWWYYFTHKSIDS